MFEQTEKPSRQRTLILFTALLLAGFVFAVYLVFSPDQFPMSFVRGPVVRPAPDLIFGPYPVEEELLKLKRMGVVEVVSLLDANSPIEGELVARERQRVEGLGMTFVSHPLPVSFAATGGDPEILGRVADYIRDNPVSLRYVHCYLGRHRVQLVRDVLGLTQAAPVLEVGQPASVGS
jgi:hypothetical protein